ncbi:MAG: hypothetical protein QOI91_620 [Solirubrobacteraceae bacterium]|nr:hypothetical protein [Solirubrobacteraceae bacterium]
MKKVLVVANQTIGGGKLLDTVRARAAEGDVSFALVVPRNRPPSGGIIYDDAVRHAAEVRLSLAKQFMAQEGVQIEGDVGDEDPFTAAMDGIALYNPDEVLVSTLPRTSSGWLRRDLVERIRDESGLPVEHLVSDLDEEGLPFHVTLVLANQTMGAEALLEHLKSKAAEHETMFIVVVPQEGGHGHHSGQARARLQSTLRSFRDAGLLAAGTIGNPDPYQAARNALASFRVDDVVVSTLEATKSGWLRGNIIERLQESTGKPVEHVESGSPTPAASA